MMIFEPTESTRVWKVKDPSPSALEYIRKTIPKDYKYYNVDEGCWFVSHKYVVPIAQIQLANSIESVVVKHLPEAWRKEILEYKDKSILKNKPSIQNDSAYAVLHLLPNAPRLIIDAAWKALAKQHHPDRGGDAETFKKYSEAYEKITKGQ